MNQTTVFSNLRIATTPFLLLTRGSPLFMAVLLLLLDLIDCDVKKAWNKKIYDETQCKKNFQYQSCDKLIDVSQYIVGISLLYKYSGMSYSYIQLLLFFTFWRFIGVIFFIYYRDTRYLVPFFDVTKELMVLWVIMNGKVSTNAIALICICKLIFEQLKNGKKQEYV